MDPFIRDPLRPDAEKTDAGESATLASDPSASGMTGDTLDAASYTDPAGRPEASPGDSPDLAGDFGGGAFSDAASSPEDYAMKMEMGGEADDAAIPPWPFQDAVATGSSEAGTGDPADFAGKIEPTTASADTAADAGQASEWPIYGTPTAEAATPSGGAAVGDFNAPGTSDAGMTGDALDAVTHKDVLDAPDASAGDSADLAGASPEDYALKMEMGGEGDVASMQDFNAPSPSEAGMGGDPLDAVTIKQAPIYSTPTDQGGVAGAEPADAVNQSPDAIPPWPNAPSPDAASTAGQASPGSGAGLDAKDSAGMEDEPSTLLGDGFEAEAISTGSADIPSADELPQPDEFTTPEG